MKYATVCKCPDCGDKFKVPHGEPLPNFCPLCGSYVGVDENFVPSKLNMPSSLGKSADWSYRKLEADSEARAEAAVPMIEEQLVQAGMPREEAQRRAVAQANEIKVTNMRDNMREGDVAAVPVKNTVTDVADAMASAGLWNGYFQNGSPSAGPAPVNESGAKVLMGIQSGRASSPPPSVAGLSGGFGRV